MISKTQRPRENSASWSRLRKSHEQKHVLDALAIDKMFNNPRDGESSGTIHRVLPSQMDLDKRIDLGLADSSEFYNLESQEKL
jgi:hypothetical protein